MINQQYNYESMQQMKSILTKSASVTEAYH